MIKKLAYLLLLWPLSSGAQIAIEAPAGDAFRANVEGILSVLKNSPDGNLRKLYASANGAPHPITIRPVSKDPTTWLGGSPNRSHCHAAQGHTPNDHGQGVPAVVFLFPHRADPSEADFRNGTLAHELVHAVDIANGRYYKESEIREKRAVVFQNIWRRSVGRKLRRDYHGQFPTSEYETFKKSGKLDFLADHILTKSGLPSP